MISDAAPDFYEKCLKISELFAEAHKLMNKKELLSDMEIFTLEKLCHDFGEFYPIYFPDQPCCFYVVTLFK